jgi:putative membrane protein
MRLVFMSSALAVLALTSALGQSPDRPRTPTPPANPGFAPPSPNPAPGARDRNAGAAPARQHPNAVDQAFLIRAARGGLDEIDLARLAEQKAGSQSVREFARLMTRDHQQTNDALSRLTEGEAVPDQPDPEDRQLRDALSSLSGPEFDIEYMRLQVPAHQRMAQLLEYEIGSGADAQVQRFASDTLPRVYAHLAMARQLLDQVSMQNPQIAAAPPRKASGMPTPQTPRATLN